MEIKLKKQLHIRNTTYMIIKKVVSLSSSFENVSLNIQKLTSIVNEGRMNSRMISMI